MENLMPQIMQMATVTRFGYIIYRPKTTRIKQDIHYNHEAHQILSFSGLSPGKETRSRSVLSNLCEKWKKILEQRMKDLRKPGDRDPVTRSFIELYQSGKRKYIVRVVILYDQAHSSKGQNQYMFILERIRSDLLNIPQISREWKLNKREQDLIQLLLSGMSNKEIAYALGLSLNTVKAYMKLLMRKLGVNSRAGIITLVLTKKKPS
jgi:DNA-binding CsgD family transcriptional regulator